MVAIGDVQLVGASSRLIGVGPGEEPLPGHHVAWSGGGPGCRLGASPEMGTPRGAEACGRPVNRPLAYIGTTRRREGIGINDTEGALDGPIRGRIGGIGGSVRRDDAPQRALNRDGGLEEPACADQAGGF